jgi:hypothetical protein
MADIYLHLNGEQKGPYPAEKVRAMLASGEIAPDTLAWYDGLPQWSNVTAVIGPPPAPKPGALPPPSVAKKGMSGWLIALIVIGGLAVLSVPCCCGIALGPITAGIKIAKENVAMQHARIIAIAMSVYATDHNCAYPDGTTSTEVFQKLLDGKYVTDPAMFYLEMPGKTKPTSTQLTSANVSFDVTSGVTNDSPGELPVVFCTGYTVIYTAGAAAGRDSGSDTPFPGPGHKFTGIAVAYKDISGRFLYAEPDGSVPNFIPPIFDAGGKTYVQLKP